jgi:hypothetical protein
LWCSCIPAAAQVDTPSAAAARKALRNIVDTYSTRPGWATWSHRLALRDVEYELRLGDRSEPEVFAATARRIRAGANSDFRAAPLQRLADALEMRVTELEPIPIDEWPAECQRSAENYAPITPEAVQAARQELLDRLDALERRLPTLANPKDPWRYFLSYPAARDLVYTDIRDARALDRLETRWQGATSVWDGPEMIEASLAVQAYVRLYRGYLANESEQEHVAAWTALAEQLARMASSEGGGADRIAALVGQRERLGQGSRLTASIRRHFSRPNVILQARLPWVQDQMAQRLNERYDVNDVYAGARTYGSGTLSGTIRCEILPSSSVGHARLILDAISRASTQGSSEGVSVFSSANTRVRGEQRFVLDDGGLVAGPAAAAADTSITYNSINAPGLRRRRSEAVRRTYARRPQAEADAEAATRREIMARMNAEGSELVAKFNKSYTQLRDRQFAVHRRAPEIRVRSDGDTVRWECRLDSPVLFAAPDAPPPFERQTDVTLCIAASALEEQCLGSLAGRQLTGDELSKTIGELVGAAPQENVKGGDFSAKFADFPCRIEFADGKLQATFFITSFDSADVQYPAMTVEARYNVELREGDLALVREGGVRVRPLAAPGDESPELSGRQQTLRLAVQRKLNRALAETYTWAGPALPLDGNQDDTLRIQSARADQDWLQLALNRAPARRAPQTRPATRTAAAK